MEPTHTRTGENTVAEQVAMTFPITRIAMRTNQAFPLNAPSEVNMDPASNLERPTNAMRDERPSVWITQISPAQPRAFLRTSLQPQGIIPSLPRLLGGTTSFSVGSTTIATGWISPNNLCKLRPCSSAEGGRQKTISSGFDARSSPKLA